MKSTKDIIKRILLEQAPPEGEEFSPPDGPPYNDYYDVGLALRRIVVNKDTGEWIDTDYIDEESIQTSWDIKDAEKMYQRKLYEIKFFDTKGKIKESRDYSDKEQVKEMIADNLTNEIISMLDYGDIKLTYEDLNDILTNVFENAEFLFMDDDSFTLTEQKVISEQKQYSDDHYDYSPYRGINTSKIEREIKRAINTKSRSISYSPGYPEGEKIVTYNDPNLVNPHLEQDIKRLAERIMYAMHEDTLVYVGENYEGEIVDIMNGDFD